MQSPVITMLCTLAKKNLLRTIYIWQWVIMYLFIFNIMSLWKNKNNFLIGNVHFIMAPVERFLLFWSWLCSLHDLKYVSLAEVYFINQIREHITMLPMCFQSLKFLSDCNVIETEEKYPGENTQLKSSSV